MPNSNGNRYGGLVDPLMLNELHQVVNAQTTLRSRLSKAMEDPRRSIDDDCGYPKTEQLGPEDYKAAYDREAIATRVVDVLPRETWQSQPTVIEDDDPDKETEFEEGWKAVAQQLQGGEESWFEGEEGNPIWSYLQRLDEMSGIGMYGVMLLGTDDGKELNMPLKGKEGRKLLYLRVFDESLAPISTYDDDPKSNRFGQPIQYNLTFNDPREGSRFGMGGASVTRQVHWSRVIHVADNPGTSEIFGVPRMRPVWNRLMDLRKLYGGSAEMYWRGAFPGISFETHPQLGGDVSIDNDDFKDAVEQYSNTLQRYIISMGMSAKVLSPTVSDPTAQINVQIEALCIQLGIPRRIFVGSERGELASSQDERAWISRLVYRRHYHVTPRVIVPFANRLIQIGVLARPEKYSVVWPELGGLDQSQQATIAVQRTEAMAKYVGGNLEAFITPMDFLTRVLGMESAEAEAMIEATLDVEDEDRLTTSPEPVPGQAPVDEEGNPIVPPGVAPPGEEVEEGEEGKPPFGKKPKPGEEEVAIPKPPKKNSDKKKAFMAGKKKKKAPTSNKSKKKKGGTSNPFDDKLLENYNPSQPRDSSGKFGSGGGGGGGAIVESDLDNIAGWTDTSYGGQTKEALVKFEGTLDKLPEHEGTIHRAITVDSEKDFVGVRGDRIQADEIVHTTRPYSATKSKEYVDTSIEVNDPSKTVILLEVKAKSGADIGKHDSKAGYRGQEEVVMRAGTSYVIDEVKRSKGEHGGKLVKVKMREVYKNEFFKKKYRKEIGITENVVSTDKWTYGTLSGDVLKWPPFIWASAADVEGLKKD